MLTKLLWVDTFPDLLVYRPWLALLWTWLGDLARSRRSNAVGCAAPILAAWRRQGGIATLIRWGFCQGGEYLNGALANGATVSLGKNRSERVRGRCDFSTRKVGDRRVNDLLGFFLTKMRLCSLRNGDLSPDSTLILLWSGKRLSCFSRRRGGCMIFIRCSRSTPLPSYRPRLGTCVDRLGKVEASADLDRTSKCHQSASWHHPSVTLGACPSTRVQVNVGIPPHQSAPQLGPTRSRLSIE